MKRLLSLVIVGFLLIAFTHVGYADVVKNETVYVSLKHDGSTEKITIVNHLSGSSNEEYFIDYGKYDLFQNLTKDVEPIIDSSKIKWPTKALNDGDIYYEGTLKKELPIKLNIKYFLDGKEIYAPELAGKTGKIKILISIKDSPYLTTQIQVPLSLNVFSNIHAPSGVTSVVGKTMTVVFNHLPMGDEEYMIEADGKNIELESIIISGTTSKINLPDNLGDGVNQLTNGIDQMSEATEKLYNGSVELNNGTNSLVKGLQSLKDGISKLSSGSKEIDNNSKIITKGFLDFNYGLLELKDNLIGFTKGVNDINTGLTTLNQQGNNMNLGLASLSGGITELKNGLDGLSGGLSQLNAGHGQLVELAKSLSSSSDPKVRALAEGVIKEGISITALSQGANETATGMDSLSQSTKELSEGFKQFSSGLDAAAKGFDQMNEGLKPLPKELDMVIAGHTQLTDGLTPLFAGISGISEGLGTLSNDTKALPQEVEKLAEGQGSISEGLRKLNDDGFSKIKSSLKDFSALEGNGDKEEYRSFVDNEKNLNSTVQFIMKTSPVKIDKDKVPSNPPTSTTVVKKNLFQRLLDLFRK